MGRNRDALAFGVAVLAALAAGCQQTANTNNTNAPVVANANVYSNANSNAGGGGINADISREEFERQKERFERQAREAGRKVGPGASDLWLWTKARAALAAADDLRDSTINVDVDKSVVTLTGTVATNEQKAKAGQAARVEGVSRVVNNLAVSAAGGSKAERNANAK